MKKTLVTILLIAGTLFFTSAVFADTIDVSIPGTTASSNPVEIIAGFYKFALSISGILAVGVIIFGAVKYMASPGNPSGQNDAREWITSAFWGILLLAGGYLILNTVNPELTLLRLPTLKSIDVPSSTPSIFDDGDLDFSTAECKSYKLTPLTPDAQAMEKGQTIVWDSDVVSVNANLDKLQVEFVKMDKALEKIGASARANSVYRPLSYQRHLYEIFSLNKILANDKTVECAALKNLVKTEMAKHGIQGAVATPNPCAPHVSGKAIDITLSGMPYRDVNAFLKKEKIDLEWAAISGDEVHFKLLNPPYPSACGK